MYINMLTYFYIKISSKYKKKMFSLLNQTFLSSTIFKIKTLSDYYKLPAELLT